MIHFLIMDVDGTLTDGKIYMGPNGEMMKSFDIKDGCGIKDILPKMQIVPIIITARNSKILENRCKELNIRHIYQSERNKLKKLIEILEQTSNEDGIVYTLKNCAYIGDDILDLQCMEPIVEAGGITGCPSDAVDAIINVATFISSKPGGGGAVREFIEWIKSRNYI